MRIFPELKFIHSKQILFMHSLMSCKEDIEILLMDVWPVVHEGIRTPDAGGCERNVEKSSGGRSAGNSEIFGRLRPRDQ